MKGITGQFHINVSSLNMVMRNLKSSEPKLNQRSIHSSRFLRNASQSQSANSQLTWNEFLSLRSKRRTVSNITSGFTTVFGISTGWAFLANIEIDPTQQILGLDPIWVLGGGLVLCGGLGYLVGPTVGDFVFRTFMLKSSAQRASFSERNTEFLKHIRRNRPDPRSQSYANPVPDYYGEKVKSLTGYRKWLRDGSAYRRKVEKFIE